MVSCHSACVFGASVSVYNLERVGALITVIAARCWGIRVYRYVDGIFAPERVESMHHAMLRIVRLIRDVLGQDATEDRI